MERRVLAVAGSAGGEVPDQDESMEAARAPESEQHRGLEPGIDRREKRAPGLGAAAAQHLE